MAGFREWACVSLVTLCCGLSVADGGVVGTSSMRRESLRPIGTKRNETALELLGGQEHRCW